MIKRPAHEVILNELAENVADLKDFDCPDCMGETTAKTLIPVLLSSISCCLGLLMKMLIPEKEIENVIKTLRKIKENCPKDYADDFFPEMVFSDLSKDLPKSGKGNILISSGEGISDNSSDHKLPNADFEISRQEILETF